MSAELGCTVTQTYVNTGQCKLLALDSDAPVIRHVSVAEFSSSFSYFDI